MSATVAAAETTLQENRRLHRNALGRRMLKKTALYAVLIAVSALMLYPLLLLVNVSLKTTEEFYNLPTGLVRHITFENYATVWKGMDVFRRFLTTVWMTALSCLINIVVCILAAFPLSRGYFGCSGKVYVYMLISMFFPGSLVANIVILNDIMHVYGTPVALIIIWTLGSLQMNIFMLVGFIKTLPRDLDDAAFVDGCGYFRYVFVMAMPLMFPIISTLLMLKVIGAWNDFLNPFIYITDPAFRTLSTGLYQYMGQYGATWNYFTAAIFIVALPMVIIYIFCQKFIISGVIAGALKG